jgi:hypothetical protein
MSKPAVPMPAMPRTVPELLAAARATAGLDDFGDPAFLEGLERVSAGMRNEAQLTPVGEQFAFGGLLNMLVNRLRYVRDLRRHPQILDEAIIGPVIILGLPRTGTTKLLRVLAADPQAQSLTYWRMMNPSPFPDEIPGQPSGRIEAAKAAVQVLAENFPGFMARHPTDAMLPDEEVLLMQGSFKCVVTWLFARMPSFYDWVMNTDARPAYDYLRSQMQYLQWQDGGARGRPWVLKSPCHTGLIDTVLAVFPNAFFVHCHRDVRKVIPSIAGLVEEMRRIHSDPVDPTVIGPEMVEYFGRLTDQYLTQRDALPADRFMDVRYEDVLTDVVGVLRRIYERTGRVLTPEAIAGVHAFEKENPQHQFGSYTYPPERYGLEPGLIQSRFAAYRKRFAPFITE